MSKHTLLDDAIRNLLDTSFWIMILIIVNLSVTVSVGETASELEGSGESDTMTDLPDVYKRQC